MELDDAAYEAALATFDAWGLQAAYRAALACYAQAGIAPDQARQQAHITCTIIVGDAAYEKFLATCAAEASDREVLHHFAEREAQYAAQAVQVE